MNQIPMLERFAAQSLIDHGGELIFSKEKFAEFIVQECMSCSTWVGRANTTAIEPMHTAHAINQRIRKHFGVEE